MAQGSGKVSLCGLEGYYYQPGAHCMARHRTKNQFLVQQSFYPMLAFPELMFCIDLYFMPWLASNAFKEFVHIN